MYPYYADPIQEATGLPAPLFIFVVIICVTAAILGIWIAVAKTPPPFTDEQEKRIREIVAEEKGKTED